MGEVSLYSEAGLSYPKPPPGRTLPFPRPPGTHTSILTTFPSAPREADPSISRSQHVRPHYRGTSLRRKRLPLGPHSTPMPRVLVRSQGGERFLMGEVPLYPPGLRQVADPPLWGYNPV